MKKNNQYSEIYQTIWNVVQQIPWGRVATYGQIAKLAGLGAHARIVGYALHSLPHDSSVPWHRVINSKGKISLSKADGQYDLQKTLLEQEGIVFHGETIDLKRFGWKPGTERSDGLRHKI